MESAQAQARLRKICTTKKREERKEEEQRHVARPDDDEEEPVSPAGRLFHQPSFTCHIIVIVGFRTEIDVDAIKRGLQATLIRHKRFSSVPVSAGRGGGAPRWVRAEVDVDRHVIVPAGPEEGEGAAVEDYASRLCTAGPMDPSRPLWELHLLKARTAEAPGGSAVLRIHHSLGDGVSLMSLFLACTRRVAEPESLPAVPRPRPAPKRAPGGGALAALWTLMLAVWYTLAGAACFLATSLWRSDSRTAIKGSAGVELRPKRLRHATLDLEDIKIVKNGIRGTVNDVLLGITAAALARCLDRAGAERRESLLVRAAVLVNTRSTPGLHEVAEMMKPGGGSRWGNSLGYLLIRLPVGRFDDPLDYARAAAAISRKKKLSLEAQFSYASGKLLLMLAGIKAAAFMTYRVICNTTFSFSNVVGPVEEVQFMGHPVTHIAPTVSGHPHVGILSPLYSQALTVHFQSYMGRVKVVVNVAEDVISDPERLCTDFIDALHRMKQQAMAATSAEARRHN